MNQITKAGSASRLWLRALEAVSVVEQDHSLTFGAVLNDLADLYGENTALIDEEKSLTYRELAVCSNRYTRWARSKDFPPGTVVALLMRNCAEYVAIWAGLSAAGYTVALINTNLTGPALTHAIRVAHCHAIIVEAALHDEFRAVSGELSVDAYMHGAVQSSSAPRVDLEILSHSGRRPKASGLPEKPALLIYTSGTTGLPKAAKVSHGRVLQWSYWFAGLMEAEETDKIYNCLPMYHSTGGICAIGALLVRGGSVIIRRRFSGSRFWQDIVETRATIFQYIGELCRYLLQVPQDSYEALHGLRLCSGNGLREDVWRVFEQRFRIPRILEFYAATEGSISLYNCDGKPGAIGRIPGFLAHRFPMALVQFNPDTGEHLRGESGYCLPCAAGEVGEALGLLDPENLAPGQRFEGYLDSALSGGKIARNVFREGDLWYRTGDLMRRDKEGFYYFVDRLGDTFRWKGENVSAAEVASVIAACPGIVDAVVFGVKLPHHEGQAGMAAIATDENFDIARLWAHIHRRLPSYACPVFIRRCTAIDRTGTFKLSAGKLKAEGYLQATGGDLWFDDRKSQSYVPFSGELQTTLETGALRI